MKGRPNAPSDFLISVRISADHLPPSVSNFIQTLRNERALHSIFGREGGAPQPKSERNREARAALAKEEEHALRCLGAAVIMHWNDLPTKIQRDLFDHAISMGEPRYTAQLKERIARFLHRHRNDEFGKIPTPPVVKART